MIEAEVPVRVLIEATTEGHFVGGCVKLSPGSGGGGGGSGLR